VRYPFKYPVLRGPIVVTSPYGERVDPTDKTKRQFHSGLDLRAAKGTPFYAPHDASVVQVWTDTTYGGGLSLLIDVKGWRIGFAHLDRVDVVAGDAVDVGTLLGATGNSGLHTNAPHLHIGLRTPAGERVDPKPFLFDDDDEPDGAGGGLGKLVALGVAGAIAKALL